MISFLEIIIYSLFILSVNSLSEPKKAYRGNLMAIAAMAPPDGPLRAYREAV